MSIKVSALLKQIEELEAKVKEHKAIADQYWQIAMSYKPVLGGLFYVRVNKR